MERASTASKLRSDPRLIIAVVAFAAVGFYLSVSAWTFRVGFPLDDTWIHLTYARNLAEHGEWAFRLGERSAGSTAPLWTVLISLGYYLDLAPYAWTFFLGWLVLTALGIASEYVSRKLNPAYRSQLPLVGIFFVLAWHLTWAAVSGMETLLHAFLIFIVLSRLMLGNKQYLTLGFLAGLSVWVRPDGLTLLGPILFTASFVENSWPLRGKAFANILLGFGALYFLYLLFNLLISGNPMPNTFYAKQAEYEAYWLAMPVSQRVTDYLSPIIASPFVVLVPGVWIWLVESVRTRNWGSLSGMIWFIGYIAIYFNRLPAYQHGRYIIPSLPILYLWGSLGLLQYIASPTAIKRVVFIWTSLVGVLSLMFTYIGARQNAADVYWIETEMVATAAWINQNVPPDALLAVHDIGAVGYFVPNPLIDMAGLINPEVVPFIRDEDRLAELLDKNSADYLVVLPGFYPQLTSGRQPIFIGGSEINEITNGEHMVVYRWR